MEKIIISFLELIISRFYLIEITCTCIYINALNTRLNIKQKSNEIFSDLVLTSLATTGAIVRYSHTPLHGAKFWINQFGIDALLIRQIYIL